MRWAHHCSLPSPNLLFSISTLDGLYRLDHVRAGGAVVRILRRLVLNERCLCILTFKDPAAHSKLLIIPLFPQSSPSAKPCASIQSSLSLPLLMTSWSEPCVTFSFI